MTINNIVIITANFPQKSRPVDGTFVKEIVRAFARTGVSCTVIRPINLFRRSHGPLPPVYLDETEAGHAPIVVLSPNYISFSNRRLFKFNTGKLTLLSFEAAVLNAFRNIDNKPDIVYGHFLYPSGKAAARLGQMIGVPTFVAVGESVSPSNSLIWSIRPFGIEQARKDLKEVTGFIAVSTLLKKKLLEQLGISSDRIKVSPNGVDLTVFYPRVRVETRRKLGLPKDQFIVTFVGRFDQRKGVLRVLKAVDGLPNVNLVLLGSGPESPESPSIFYKGRVEHEKIPEFLSASDVFLLPTEGEGSSNAILEALACGLPVVSSIGEFNDDILNDDVSIRVNPLDVQSIRSAICLLRDSPNLRKRMSENAIEWVKQFNIDLRAQKILDWMSVRLGRTV